MPTAEAFPTMSTQTSHTDAESPEKDHREEQSNECPICHRRPFVGPAKAAHIRDEHTPADLGMEPAPNPAPNKRAPPEEVDVEAAMLEHADGGEADE